jgi:hypothetical protein
MEHKEKIEIIKQILLKYEDSLSDGYRFYCCYEYAEPEIEREQLEGQLTIIAEEILKCING